MSAFSPPSGQPVPGKNSSLVPAGYEILETLCSDSGCALYLSRHTRSRALHHITRFLKLSARLEGDCANLFRSVLAAQRELEAHPGIEKLADVYETSDAFLTVSMPILHTSVQEILNASGARSFDWTLELAEQLGDILDFVASRGTQHGSVTPLNVRIDLESARVTLANYMASNLLAPSLDAYSAPERLKGAPVSASADLYSLGAMMFTCVSGRPPFVGADSADLTRQILEGYLPDLPAAPGYINAILHRLMASAPVNRYRRASDALADLRGRSIPQTGTRDPLTVAAEFDVIPKLAPRDSTRAHSEDTSQTEPAEQGNPAPDGAINGGVHKASFGKFVRTASCAIGRTLSAALTLIMVPLGRGKAVRRESGSWYLPIRKHTIFETRLKRAIYLTVAIAARIIVVGGLLICAHALFLANQQRLAEVTHVKGSPGVAIVRIHSAIAEGDRLDAGDQPIIETGPSDTVALTAGDAAIHVDERSTLQIVRLDIDGGRVRVFNLVNGQAEFYTPQLYGSSSQFEVNTGSVRARTRNSAFRVIRGPSGFTVQVASGTAVVEALGIPYSLKAGSQCTVQGSDSKLHISRLPEASATAIVADTGGARQQSLWSSVAQRYFRMMEDKMMMPATRVLEVVKLKPTVYDPTQNAKAITTSTAALLTINMAIVNLDEPPSQLELDSLDGLHLKKRICVGLLARFESHRLVAYYRLGRGKFALFARSQDASHTLLQAINGTVTSIKQEDEEKALARAEKQWREQQRSKSD